MTETTVVTTREQFHAVAADAPADARVPVEVRTVVADPFDAYRRARDERGGAFLETTGGQAGWGYFGVDPVDRLTVSGDAVLAGNWRADDADRRFGSKRSETLAALDGLLGGEQLARGDCDVPYPCGAIGWLSYDIARELESLPESDRDDRGLPALQVAVYHCLAAWEEPRDGDTTLRITACPEVAGDPDEAALDACYDRALADARELARQVHVGDPDVGPAPAAADEAAFESTCGREQFRERVRRVKAYVREGDTFQANVSQRLAAPAAVHPVDAYAALRAVNPAPYSGLLEFRGVDLVSASPELLLDRDGDRLLTEPIAGTRPRGDTDDADAALADDLAADEKERAEHAMLVDLERNDLGKISEYGSVEVTEYRRIDRYAEVMHLVSLIEGRLREDATLADAVAATFPGGTITGAPKPRTMEIIDELEGRRRGPYTGSMGIFGFDGRATLNIVIRTLVRHADEYHLSVGAGIVHDSEPDAEYEETLDKARALIRAVDDALEQGELGVAEDPGADGGDAAAEPVDGEPRAER
ncbi:MULTISPECIES: aminodeoxychorismate synthase, component I [Halolamina]|uniref:anthranilate synthase n=1 Tax=Halolamina pelagica TaxID=699431 RepID=A0A1I5R2R1_9EURY|nr:MULTISPECIES: aminodeoxychorismate synthase, component I [Halolamina]NHX35663.1 aminodeoxychorismate synthase, component I [Halolamina sp. R1-12]SFP52808.1 anthranilate synthase component 1 [Halolamina pelagica]